MMSESRKRTRNVSPKAAIKVSTWQNLCSINVRRLMCKKKPSMMQVGVCDAAEAQVACLLDKNLFLDEDEDGY